MRWLSYVLCVAVIVLSAAMFSLPGLPPVAARVLNALTIGVCVVVNLKGRQLGLTLRSTVADVHAVAQKWQLIAPLEAVAFLVGVAALLFHR
jgi:hypothetical protein